MYKVGRMFGKKKIESDEETVALSQAEVDRLLKNSAPAVQKKTISKEKKKKQKHLKRQKQQKKLGKKQIQKKKLFLKKLFLKLQKKRLLKVQPLQKLFQNFLFITTANFTELQN